MGSGVPDAREQRMVSSLRLGCATSSVSLGSKDARGGSSLKGPSLGSRKISTENELACRLRTNVTIVEEINGIGMKVIGVVHSGGCVVTGDSP